jgi:hypothetical protein
MKKTLLASSIAIITLSSALNTQAENFNQVIDDSKVDVNFRLRVESVDQDNALDNALAATLKSRVTFESGAYNGFSALVEGDNVLHIIDDFNDGNGNGNTQYSTVVDPETTQFNQAYIQYSGFESTIKVGNQRIVLDNQRHVGGVAWRQDEATFDAVSVKNTSIEKTTLFAAAANNRNTIKNENTEESIILLNAKYAQSKDLAVTGFYYSIADTNGIDGLDFDTLGLRATGMAAGFGYEAELASQSKETAAGGDYSTLYYHLNGSKKFSSVKATLGYEVFGSDDGTAAFATPLGTNHKFFGWTDTYLTGAGDNGIEDIYLSAVTKVSGVKLVGQLHNFSSNEGGDALGNELGFVVAKNFDNYGVDLKVAQYLASNFAENNLNKVDTTKIWLTGTAKF